LAHAELIERARKLPRDLPPRALSLIVFVEALRTSGGSTSREEVASVVSSVLQAVRREIGSPPSTALTESAEGGTAAGQPQQRPQPESVSTAASAGLNTQFGGLFYLLALAVELEIGETLWKVCLPEGAVLANCAAQLLGAAAEHDPAAAVFGGVPALQRIDVSPQQQEEVAAELAGSLAAALPRRSLAKLPEVALCLAPAGASPALVASERGSPFPLFVWPAADARRVERGLRVFLARWPASAPRLLGTPAIAELEGGVRVRASSGLAMPRELFLPVTGSAWTSALIAQIAGALCHVFAARAGMDTPSGTAALVGLYLAVPAKIDRSAEEMIVRLPISRIELPLRRSGLDRDPGWIPWLGCTVRFVFEADAPSG